MEKQIGTMWFKKFKKEAEAMSSHIRFKRIKYGFFRIFWCGDGISAYVGECHKDMSEIGYEIEEKNFQLENKKYYEDYEDNAEYIQKIKNFKEGYWDSKSRLLTCVYMLKNNSEYRRKAQQAYSQFIVK